MQPFRQQQSQALRPAVQQTMQQPMQRAMQQPMQQAQTMQQPMQQRSQPMQQQQRSPMVQRPQAMQPTPTRVQQPMQRGQLNAPAVMPREMPTSQYDGSGMPGRTIPGTNQNGTRYGSQPAPPGGGYSPVPPATTMPSRFGGVSGGIFESDGAGGMRVIEPGPGNELSSTGQRGMPKYDPRGMGGGEYQMPRNTGYGGGGPRNPDGTPVATTGMGINEDLLMQPGGGGFSKLDPRYTNPMSGGFVGPSRTGGNELVGHHGIGFGQDSPLARDNPQFDAPIGHAGIGFGQDSPLARDNPQFGMPPSMPPEMNQLHRTQAFKRGGKVTAVKKYAKGGTVKSTPVKASSRGDGIAQRGKTKGKIY